MSCTKNSNSRNFSLNNIRGYEHSHWRQTDLILNTCSVYENVGKLLNLPKDQMHHLEYDVILPAFQECCNKCRNSDKHSVCIK